jgi:hypothetical protein
LRKFGTISLKIKSVLEDEPLYNFKSKPPINPSKDNNIPIYATVYSELQFEAVTNVQPDNISWELEETPKSNGASFGFTSSAEIVEYELILELFNEAAEQTYYLDIFTQAALRDLPYLEYPTGESLSQPLLMFVNVGINRVVLSILSDPR